LSQEEIIHRMVHEGHHHVHRYLNETSELSCPGTLPNSTYQERVDFLKSLLDQAETGNLTDPANPCKVLTDYFDFLVDLMDLGFGVSSSSRNSNNNGRNNTVGISVIVA